jgi:hypothetical protein
MKKHSFIKHVASLLFCSLLLDAHIACCCDNNKAKYEKTENLSAPSVPGQTLYLQNNVGKITVNGADVKDCDVTATITAKATTEEKAQKLAEEVRIKLEPSDNKLYIKVEQPDNKSEQSINIDFDITVPKETALNLTTDVGEINITNITKSIKAETDVGAVHCREISDNIDLQTDVGEVTVLYSQTAPGACNANIKTDVGKIDFNAPPDLSAQVNFSTNIGSIETDLPLDIKGMLGKNSSGIIGKGEGRVALKTNIGSIKIK